MSWLGRTLGVVTGTMAGGPVGAGIGGALGYALDKWLEGDGTSSTPPSPDPSDDDMEVMLRACFLAQFAAKSEHFGQIERSTIMELAFQDHPGNSELSPELLIQQLDELSVSDHLVNSVFTVASITPNWRRLLLHLGCRLISKRSVMTGRDASALVEVCQRMGGDADLANAVLVWYFREREDASDIDAARKLLGAQPGATKEELQRRYREASLAYHPDRHVDIDCHLRDLAAERFRQISAAYSLLFEYDDSYFGMSDSSRRLKRAEGRAVVRCFGCRQRCRLPSVEHFVTVRCPKCQKLLLFREAAARAALEAISGC